MPTSIDLPLEIQQHLESADACRKSGDLERALRECEIVLEASPLCAQAHNLRGMILEKQGLKAAAVQEYETAVRLDPQSIQAHRNLIVAKMEARVQDRIEVRVSLFFKIVGGGLTLFFLALAGVMIWMSIDFENWLGLVIAAGLVGFVVYLWLNTRRWPRIIDQEGITRRDGRRVLWKDLTKIERLTGRAYGIRLSGGLRLHFREDQIVEIAPNSITPSARVVRFVAQKTGAYPG